LSIHKRLSLGLKEAERPPVLLCLAGALVFANSFCGVFVFDEHNTITFNPNIQHLWPLDCIFTYPDATRPIVALTFAVNYAMHGLHYWTFHLFNLAIHSIAALTLYGIARRTFVSPRLRERFGNDAEKLAFFIALIWMVHPLQTAAVTYVIQRAESLMGMFYLLTLYSAIRAASDDTAHPLRWTWAAIAFCALGMGSKQVMVTAPLLVLLYDRTFLSGGILAALRKRFGLYAGLFATWIILWSSFSPLHKATSAGFGITSVTPGHYALTQFGVIRYYADLVFWPDPLCIDHGWPFATSVFDVWPGILVVGTLLVCTVSGALRNTCWSFLGAWFFLILAPTSSIMPIQDPVFEHRMYLPLAACAAAFVLGVEAISRDVFQKPKYATAVLCIAAAALSARTIVRNADYSDPVKIWQSAARQYPQTPRILNNFGNALAVDGQHLRAVEQFEEAARLSPTYTDPQFNLAVEMNVLGNAEAAIRHYRRALELDANYPNAHYYMGMILQEQERFDEAVSQYEAELRRDSARAEVQLKRNEAALWRAYADDGE
jgi:tetratricopeptide (TPR) repeat protein